MKLMLAADLHSGYGGSCVVYGTTIIREKKVNSALNDGTLAQRTDTCPEHKQTQIMHANQIQYFRVLHIIKSVVVVVHAGHFKTCYAKVLTHSTLLPMILAGSGGVRGAFNSMHALH